MERVDRTGEMATFLKVACAGSLSGAARELAITPSAVSRIIARLEARLGVRLLVRTTRQLRLTAEGEAYARAARRILTELDETESALADRARPRGRIRVSAAFAHGRLTIVPLVGEVYYPAAYVHERAVCVDTTAAGGNASLLAAA